LRVEEVKTLILDKYQDMLHTGPLGGEGVLFYVIVFCFIVEKNIWEWEIGKHKKRD
jgi:hypothetical protein